MLDICWPVEHGHITYILQRVGSEGPLTSFFYEAGTSIIHSPLSLINQQRVIFRHADSARLQGPSSFLHTKEADTFS